MSIVKSEVKTIRCVPLTIRDIKLYLVSSIFIAANVILPWVLHHFGSAGGIFLPIYFFSLVGGLLYGYQVGFMTGMISPIVSFWLAGMPVISILPFVMIKSIFIGSSGGWLAEKLVGKNPFIISLLTVTITQLVGNLYILLRTDSLQLALADITQGYLGLLLQISLAPLIVYWLGKNEDWLGKNEKENISRNHR